LILIVGLAVIPIFYGSQSYVLQQFDYIFSLILVAVGLNIVTGFSGQLSLGPGAIFGVAAYAAAIVANDFPTDVGLFQMCLIGIVVAIVVGFILSLPARRISGFYLAMITLFAAILVPTIASSLSITGGINGISLISNEDFVQHVNGTWLYETSVGLVLLSALASWALLNSRIGRRFVMLRTSEELALSLGYPGYRTKILAFVLSSVPAGVGGALYVYSQQFVSPGSITTTLTIYLLAACVIGGFGTITGPIVGGLLILGLSQFLGGLSEYQGIAFGLILIVFTIFLPRGLLGIGKQSASLLASLQRVLPGIPAADALSRPYPSRSSSPDQPRADFSEAHSGELQSFLEVTGSRDSLVVHNAVRAFGGVIAVDHVSLVVEPGTIHGLIGSNGSGKTTLLNLISCFYKLDEGEITLGNERVDGGSPDRAARLGISRTFQQPKLYLEGTVLENLLPAAESYIRCDSFSSFLRLPKGRRTDRAARESALACLDVLGLKSLANTEAGDLPHGLRRLVEIARVLALHPRILLLDEPGAGLSLAEVDRLRVVLGEVRAAGIAILLIEHNVPLVLEVADFITALHLGRCIAQGTPAYIRGHAEVESAFLGRQQRSENGAAVEKEAQ
jgi:branched-chain amino acid transport system ATP-binding protein/branched-chain amino acid transport system permease protein